MFQKKVRVQHLLPLFLVLVFLSLFSNLQRRSGWFGQWMFNWAAPFQKVAVWFSGGVSDTWNHYFLLVGAAKENDLLKQKIEELQKQGIATQEIKSENERLHSLLNLPEASAFKKIVSRVIAFDPRAEFKTIMIDKGSDHGIRPNLPVVAAAGLVGRVGPVSKGSAQVLLITDPNSVVDVVVQRSRVRGLLVGTLGKTEFRPGVLLTRMEYLRRVSDVKEEDLLVTSGMDVLYPENLPVGTIHKVEQAEYGIFKEATVVPFVDFSQLEEVMVLKP